MNGIIGMTELTLETNLTSRQREYLGLVRSSAESLLNVINDILDFSKIEAGKLEIAEIPFFLRDTLEDTIQTLAMRAHGKGLELACRIAPEVPDALIGDPYRLGQILVNLIGNAVKFTVHGEIVVDVSLREEGPSREPPEVILVFSVADTGIGISEDKLDVVFNAFEQADNSMTRRFGGTGLGLAISTKLARLMGGDIEIESKLGQGSTFRFNVCFSLQSAPSEAAGRKTIRPLEDVRVLIVDDNATNRRILVEILVSWGILPFTACGGAEALALLGEAVALDNPFDAAVIDGMMPGMDGSELAKRIRDNPSFAALPLLLMTSEGLTNTTPRHGAVGFAACLSKPVRQSEFYNALIHSLDQAHHDSESDDSSSSSSSPLSVFNQQKNGLRILLAEDHPVNQKVAARMLEGLGYEVVTAGDGLQAINQLDLNPDGYDAVLMDIQMPVMDGFEAIARIRSLRTRSRLPVIALTAHAMRGDRESLPCRRIR